MRIAVTKLFADQAVPSAGIGGNALLIGPLSALGVPRGTAVATLLVSRIGFYAAYALLAIVMLIMLWLPSCPAVMARSVLKRPVKLPRA